jgi:ABC-type branched-subunit amino acid transport system ATPase component/ABC-type branched-subunit amino acid transport system permease subunit
MMWLFMGTRKVEASVILGVFIASLVLPPWLSPFLLTIVNFILIYAILAMSLDILMGYTGLDSLGQAAFFGVGAYVVGILTARYGFGWEAAVLLALLLSTATAALAGLVAVRVKGLFFLVVTVAVSQVLWGISHRWGELTGGWNGLRGIPRPLPILEPDINFYYVGLGIFLLAGFLMSRLVHSPFGLTLRGIKDSESRMETSGYNVWLHKYIVFVICGMFSGVAGILYGFFAQFVSPGVLAVRTSFDAMLMVIIGGAGTLIGPVIGSVAIVALRNYLSAYLDRWLIVLGIVFILTTLYAPKGMLGWLRLWRGKNPTPEIPDALARREEIKSFLPSVNPIQKGTNQTGTWRRSSSEKEALRLENIRKSFAGLVALNGVSITVHSGTRMAIIGPNGAGKTTLFNSISGIHYPTSGRISLLGKNITQLRPHVRTKMGLARTFQVTNLYPTLTTIDNIRLGIMGIQRSKYLFHLPILRVSSVNKRAEELLELIDLWDNRNTEVRHLSYGHQRQLELIMALACKPKVLLLDEPTAGLSQAETTSMVRLIKSLDPELTILIIEHDMDVAFEVADKITVLANGQVLTKGNKEEIQANSAVREVYLGSSWL